MGPGVSPTQRPQDCSNECMFILENELEVQGFKTWTVIKVELRNSEANFGRVELQTKVQAVPLVCKAWYKALLNPSCWEHLIFPPFIPRQTSQIELMKFVVNRSQRRATILSLPDSCDREALVYVSEEWESYMIFGFTLFVCMMHE